MPGTQTGGTVANADDLEARIAALETEVAGIREWVNWHKENDRVMMARFAEAQEKLRNLGEQP
jgi:hypothetical protein